MDRLYTKLEEYAKSDYYPFHMPGHKRNMNSSCGNFPFDRDITEIYDFDNLHYAEGIIKKSQENTAEIYGTKECFFSVNGSTAALLAAISASVNKGGSILMARNCHKAVYNALYLRDIHPVYIYPHEDSKLGINGGISPSRVERYLEENKEVEALLITSPTYDGVVSDVRNLAHIAHKYGIPLIVDEAHGAHFHFSDYFPVSAADLGADIVIQSLHKTLPSMTQTAVLHVCSDRVDVGKIRRFMSIYQTSSPSYILMSSIDACMDKLEKDGINMFKEFTDHLEEARKRLMNCSRIRLVLPEMLDSTGIYDFDKSKLIFSTLGTSINGKQLYDILRTEFHIEMEMKSENYVLGIASVGDTKEGLDRLCDAIESIDSKVKLVQREKESDREINSYAKMKQILTISEAMDLPQRRIRLEESVGKITGEFVYLYPPGIPVIVPGEQITGNLIRNVKRFLEKGMEVQGLSDKTNETICIVDDNNVIKQDKNLKRE